jgi:hypothetical protein
MKKTTVDEVRELKVTTSPNPFRNNVRFNIVSRKQVNLKS